MVLLTSLTSFFSFVEILYSYILPGVAKLSQLTLIFEVFLSLCIKEIPGEPIASSEIFISSSILVLIFLTNSFWIASDFSLLKIYSSKNSRPPITVSFGWDVLF